MFDMFCTQCDFLPNAERGTENVTLSGTDRKTKIPITLYNLILFDKFDKE